MVKKLIVNADDCNLTPAVTQTILQCHRRGIVSSTTWLVNLPCTANLVKKIRKEKKLGVGLHLNLTLGRPLRRSSGLGLILDEGNRFSKKKVFERLWGRNQKRRIPQALPKKLVQSIQREYAAQVSSFKKIFHRLPTHLDTHHQVHDHPAILRCLIGIARRYRIPVRQSRAMNSRRLKFRTSDYFFGDLSAQHPWSQKKLKDCLRHLPEGVSEVMCHPGRNDSALRKISGFTTGRAKEAKIFGSPAVKSFVRKQGILLTHYGVCYT